MTNVKESNEKRIPKKWGAAGKASTEAANGLRAQGLRTRNAIVEVAKQVLLDGGGLEFSVREVAARAEVSLSNLQYYFPSRLALLRAVVEPVIEQYLHDLRSTAQSKSPPQVAISELAKRSYREAQNAEASALWWHFVSFAAIDAECSQLLDDWYETLTREIAQLIRSAYPHYSAADCMHRAALLISMADGLNYHLGAGRRKRSYTRGLDSKFLAAVDCLLRAPLQVDQ